MEERKQEKQQLDPISLTSPRSQKQPELEKVFGHHFRIYQNNGGEITTYNFATFFQHAATILPGRNPYDTVIEGRLYLGMLPNHRSGHPLFELEKKDGKPRGLNVAVIEAHAMEGNTIGAMLDNVSLDDYQKRDIDHHWLFIEDHTANVELALFIETLIRMRDAYLNHIPIEVHCKSGKGRSSMVLMGFLVMMMFSCDKDISEFICKYDETIWNTWSAKVISDGSEEEDSANKTLKNVRTRERLTTVVAKMETLLKNNFRELVNVNKRRKAIIVEALMQIYAQFEQTADVVIPRSPDFCFLRDLGQSLAYKKLSMFLSNNSQGQSAKVTQDFLNQLIANGDSWYSELCQAISGTVDVSEDHLIYLIYKEEKGKTYLELLTSLKQEIDLLAVKYPEAKFSEQPTAANKDLGQKTPTSPLRNSSE